MVRRAREVGGMAKRKGAAMTAPSHVGQSDEEGPANQAREGPHLTYVSAHHLTVIQRTGTSQRVARSDILRTKFG